MPLGFSLVEVIVAVVILSIGILAMAATTGYIFARAHDSGIHAERALAVQQAVERLRAAPWTSVAGRDTASADSIGRYRIWWTVEQPKPALKQVVIISEGPGYASGQWTTSVRDTTVIGIAEPRS